MTIGLEKIDYSKYANNVHWDHGNEVLYDMVKKNFNHQKIEVTLTKILFIGRIYAAAVERRRNKNNRGNVDFYVKKVWPAIELLDLDKRIKALSSMTPCEKNTNTAALVLHKDFMRSLGKITKLDKRSFVSKYLHFHLPSFYFLYDTRAVAGIRKFQKPSKEVYSKLPKRGVDQEYAKFYCRCVELKNGIEEKRGVVFSPRQLDNLLLNYSNKK